MPSPWRSRTSAPTPASRSPSGRRAAPCSSRPPAGVECREYAPASVKQAVCGYGRADKAQVQRMVKMILALAELPTPHHAADALAVAICHALAPPLLRAAAASGNVRSRATLRVIARLRGSPWPIRLRG